MFRRFSRRSASGVWRRLFEARSCDPDFEYVIVDSGIVRAHQHASGAKRGGANQAIGRSRGGLTTKIHLAVRGPGRHARFALTAGQASDAPQAVPLVDGLAADIVMPTQPTIPTHCAGPSPHRALAVIPDNPSRAKESTRQGDLRRAA